MYVLQLMTLRDVENNTVKSTIQLIFLSTEFADIQGQQYYT